MIRPRKGVVTVDEDEDHTRCRTEDKLGWHEGSPAAREPQGAYDLFGHRFSLLAFWAQNALGETLKEGRIYIIKQA